MFILHANLISNMVSERILVCGSIAYDYIMGFSGDLNYNLTSDKEKKVFNLASMPETKAMYFGGTSGNIGYNLAKIQSKTYLLTAVGKDFVYNGYKERIEKYDGVDFIGEFYPDLFTASCYIVNDCNHNQIIIFHQGAMINCVKIHIKQKLESLDPIKIATVSPDFYPAMINWSEQLHILNIPFILDPGQVTPAFTPDDLKRVIPKAKLLIGNKFEIEMICNKLECSVEDVLSLNSNLIITKGKEGISLYENGNTHDIPACKPREVIDTTGAGDGFRAGLLTGLAHGLSLVEAANIGCAVGSFVVETSGAQTQDFTKKDLLDRIRLNYGEELNF
jgi:adenosine kinase